MNFILNLKKKKICGLLDFNRSFKIFVSRVFCFYYGLYEFKFYMNYLVLVLIF